MAAKRTIDAGLFARTEPEGEAAAKSAGDAIPAEGYVRSVSVGLKESELAILQRIADDNDVARNAVMRYFLRDAMARYRAGELEVPTTEKRRTTIDMP